MPKSKRTTVKHIHRHFKKTDPAIFKLLKQMKLEVLPQPASASKYFQQLSREIIYQQLAGKAAHAIHQRFVALLPGRRATPKNVLAISEKKMRGAGLSWAKARYVRDLAQKVLDREVRLGHLHTLDDEAVILELIKVKGIGRWTAEMFLIFTLGREDVFSHGDLGLRNGFGRVYGARKAQTQKSIEKVVSRWSPYRSYGSLALWRALDSKTEDQ